MCYFLSTHPRASIGAQALINKLKFAYGPNGPALSADIISSPAGKKRGFCLLPQPISGKVSKTTEDWRAQDSATLISSGLEALVVKP